MLQVFSIVKDLTDRIVSEFGTVPEEGEYTFYITRSNVNGKLVELKQSSFGFLVNGKKYNALNMKSSFVSDMISNFDKLRNEMQKTDSNNIKWDEASLIFEQNQKVKMNYKYP